MFDLEMSADILNTPAMDVADFNQIFLIQLGVAKPQEIAHPHGPQIG